VVSDVQKIALLVGHLFREQPHVMITSMAGELKVEEIAQNEAMNYVFKMSMWASNAVMILKNCMERIIVKTNFHSGDLCIKDGGVQVIQQIWSHNVIRITTDCGETDELPVQRRIYQTDCEIKRVISLGGGVLLKKEK